MKEHTRAFRDKLFAPQHLLANAHFFALRGWFARADGETNMRILNSLFRAIAV
ncbi:hypothetical protein Z949_1441 [Sulfitobacter guttiformis KCTC 32187]|nr:hypothetical protein Z949_1441 [Sulfitobacter guttiformis KCTC 32187]